MNYSHIPGIDKPISRLVQGTMMINTRELDKSFALLDAVYELGGRIFDTAHVYGNGDSERALGRWLADRASQFLGRVSYSLYLIHTPILGAVLVVTTKVLGEPTVAKQILAIVAGIIVSLVAAEVFYRAVERPAIMMSRRLRSGRPQPPGRPRNRRVTIMP